MITGRFISIDVPEVPQGQPIKARVKWYGLNPEFDAWNPLDPAWKSFLIAESQGRFRLKLDDTNEVQRDFTRERTFTLDTMPDREIAITFSIWAHHKTGYDWSWSEYETYMEFGYAYGATPLAFDYKFVGPGLPPSPPPTDGVQTLEVDITPATAGYVTTNPAPISGSNRWVDDSKGQFSYGTRVQVTAHPNTGYRFEKWSDEIEGGVSYSNPAYVDGVMDEHRAVKAHFIRSEEPTPEPEPEPEPEPTICSIDADCPAGYKCQGGKCVRVGGWDPSWTMPVVIGIAALALLPGGKKGK